MKEKDFQTEFNKWLKHSNFCISGKCVFELKICKGTSIPFNAVKEHQLAALSIAKHASLIYKIPDDTIAQKPFDSFCISGAAGYVVILFYKPREKHMVLIDVDVYKKEQETSKRKSLVLNRAIEIGHKFTL